jgi:hypothetical protein
MFARIGVMRALNRHHVREFDLDRVPHHGGAEAEARYVMDICDGAVWTEMDIDDLKAGIEHGRTIEESGGISVPLRLDR